MSKFRRLSALTLISLSLSGCGMPGTSPAPNAANLTVNSVADYPFEISAGFQIASVDSADQSVVDSAKTTFEADLKAGRTSDYQREKDFSIHLLSGSEGNYFTSDEFIQNSLQQVLATLVVVEDGQVPEIFKGQFENQRFVFADPGDQFALDSRTKAYLLTAGSDFSIQTYKGELVPDSEVAAGTPSAASAAAASPDVTSATASGLANRQAYNGVTINYDPNAEKPMYQAYPMFMGGPFDARNATDKYAGKTTTSRAWTMPAGQAAFSTQPGYGVQPGRATAAGGEFVGPFEPFAPFNGDLAALPVNSGPINVVPGMPSAPGVPIKGAVAVPVTKSLARGYATPPDPAKARVAEAGWFDAEGKFHPLDNKAELTRADEAKRPEVQVMRAEKRVKVQEPAYPGPDTPQ